MSDSDVLVVGAGPTGLVLALALVESGIVPRVVDRNAGPGEASRAIAVQARTLEIYRQLGIADVVVASGIRFELLRLWEEGRRVTEFRVGVMGEGMSPFPFVLSYPQDDHERFLVERLRAAGVEVEWRTELVSFADDGDRVRATLEKDGGREETCDVRYVCGCDGAHSAVRRGLGIGFPGGTYDQSFFVADAEASGPATGDALNGCLSDRGFLVVLPVRSTGRYRLIGIVPEELRDREDLTYDDVRPFVEAIAPIDVGRVAWFSTYHVHHRVADSFRAGRCFLAGDAGHVHSPVGGQGMNTGIGDAANLAWKLAAALAGRASDTILDTYEPERIAFARTLVATTDRAFTGIIDRGAGGRLVRRALVPHLVPLLFGFSWFRRLAFRTLSQTRINYRDSPLSAGEAGDVHGGDRLPWVESARNFDPLRSLDWQVHVYGTARESTTSVAAASGIAVRTFAWSDDARAAGFARDAAYLVRPDGYVAVASPDQDAEALESVLAAFEVTGRR
jgi:2-polyprenyl-6-methoxyphenol hydroxylase-like FAD-dependent oxidoreductase